MEQQKGVEISFRNASLAEIDKEAQQLESMYEVYCSMRKVTRIPGDLSMNLSIRDGEDEVSAEGVTRERLLGDATRYRILQGLREHVVNNVGDVQRFELAFQLKCREIPEELEMAEQIRGIGRTR